MDSTGKIKTREREEAKLRGSVVKGEKPRSKVLLNAIKLQISSQARNTVGARNETYQQGLPQHVISQPVAS